MIVFFTYDLYAGRERLMPWRTIIEVCKIFQAKYKLNVSIFSIDKKCEKEIRSFQKITIRSISRNCYKKKKFFIKNKIQTVFFPIVWRSSKSSISQFKKFQGKKIAYFTGGVYSKKQTIISLKYINLKTSIPYLAEAFLPKKRILSILNDSGFKQIITLSDLTKQKIIDCDFKSIKVEFIPPGKDEIKISKSQNSILYNSINYENDNYFLFMGGTAKIRGIELLLKSFNKACYFDNKLKLICFLRNDPGGNDKYILNLVEKLKFKSNIQIVYKEIDRELLFNFVSKSKAVILPFLLIPSEIPLTYFEVLSLKTTILSTENGGTTEYLSNSIFISEINEKSMCKSILKVWNSQQEIKEKKLNADLKMKNHPTWDLVAERWHGLLNIK